MQNMTDNYDVLVVHFESDILLLAKMYLNLKGITCKLMRDEREVIKELEQHHPKIVILEHIYGWEICNQIKSNPNINHIRVVIMANAFMESLYKKRCKADAYIDELFDLSDFDVIVDLISK